MTDAPMPVVVLISGRGSNLQALIDASAKKQINAVIRAVISNVADAPGLERAARAGINTAVVEHKAYASRAQFDKALLDCIESFTPELVVLAGFMRVLGAEFVAHLRGRLINIHPSLLPAFPGLDTHQRAIQAGAKEHGASIHYVTAQLDGGPLIAQASVPVLESDQESTLAARVLAREHQLLPFVVGLFADHRLRLDAQEQVLIDGETTPCPLQPFNH